MSRFYGLKLAMVPAVAVAMLLALLGRHALSQTADAAQARAKKADLIGYDGTPFLPDGKWRVHDIRRPHPKVIDPGTASTAEQPGRPPSDAIVLFDGKDLSQWAAVTRGGQITPAGWKVENGYIEVVPGTGSLVSKEKFACQIHVEWAAPAEIAGASQSRGNSGVLIMSRYEIQVLDSYNNLTYADGQAAAIYGQFPPLVNASRRPGEWQTYDILFEAPRFEGGRVVKPGYVTVLHNGVAVHNHQQILGPMRHRQLPAYQPHGAEEPLMLQNHNCKVRFRNIWVRRLHGYDET
jgi:hypothetical protein